MNFRYHPKNEDTPSRIKKQIAVLGKYWFQKRYKEFKSLTKDGNDHYTLNHTPPGYEDYLLGLTAFEQANSNNEFYQEVTIELFCFDPALSNGSVCGRDVVDKVISTAADILNDAGVSSNYEGLKAVVNDVNTWVDEECEELKERFPDDDYIGVINDFLFKCKWEINHYFAPKLLALERYTGKQISDESSSSKPTIAAYGIMHVYLALAGGQPVTENNKAQLAAKYNYNSSTSGKQLKDEYDKFNNNQIATPKTHLKRLQSILPLLKDAHPKVYDTIVKDIAALMRRIKSA